MTVCESYCVTYDLIICFGSSILLIGFAGQRTDVSTALKIICGSVIRTNPTRMCDWGAVSLTKWSKITFCVFCARQWHFGIFGLRPVRQLRPLSLAEINEYIISKVSCQKGPTRHACAWQIGPIWQDTLDICYRNCHHNCCHHSITFNFRLLVWWDSPVSDDVTITAVNLPWILSGAPLASNGGTGNIQGCLIILYNDWNWFPVCHGNTEDMRKCYQNIW